MRIAVPVLIETTGSATSAKTNYVVRPLFMASVRPAIHPLLAQAKSSLVRSLRETLTTLARDQRHDALAAWSFFPDAELRIFADSLELREERLKVKLPVVLFRSLGRRIAFCPKLARTWFELGEDDDLDGRAREVFSRALREYERSGQAATTAAAAGVTGKAWIASLELELPDEQLKAQKRDPWAMLWNNQPVDGAQELHNVGRHIDALYPDALPRAVHREREVGELDAWLSGDDRRPVVVVGPRLVGKSALIYEVVRRRIERKLREEAERSETNEGNGRKPKKNRRHDEQTWLLSPQRLVSGMSYVGQWESRLTAIVKYAAKHDHLLYFDNFLGLYQAGQSRDSSLSMADVLRTSIQDRRVRVLTEMTPEAFHVWQERDRGLADQFQVLHVGESGEEETLRILLEVVRELEAMHRCAFFRSVLPAVVEIQRRYVPDAAFPGKAAAFIRQLAAKVGSRTVVPPNVHQEFHAQTGLALMMLDGSPLSRDDVRQSLEQRVVGQEAAVTACVDVVSMAKARLTSHHRPLASMLFLGPTGVGKTQCAKALAAYLFSDPDKVLRFDMNEFASSAAVARLVGTAAEPEGLLTSAVRRRPFCVVLFDEIEKAHPDVFDLLLQVTGEARLTDALGRTTNFSNAILVLTSNLGAREASASLGFGSAAARDSVYITAAERFFRPEFFNRLDRVVPFQRLDAREIRRIADFQLQELFERDGLTRRKCVLDVSSAALDAIAERGYHPQFGARALKRSIEQSIARPLAARLTSLDPDLPVLVTLHRRRGAPTLHVASLAPAAPARSAVLPPAPLEAIVRMQQALATLEQRVVALKPAASTSGYKEQGDYYVLREQLASLSHDLKSLAAALDPGRTVRGAPALGTHARGRRSARTQSAIRGRNSAPDLRQLLKEALSAGEVDEYIVDEASDSAPGENEADSRLAALRRRLTLLAAASDPRWSDGAALICVPTSMSRAFATRQAMLMVGYTQAFRALEIESATLTPGPNSSSQLDSRFAIGLAGRVGAAIAAREAGLHLFPLEREGLAGLRLTAVPLTPGVSLEEAVKRYIEARRDWLAALDQGDDEPQQDPHPSGEIVRTYHLSRTIDLKTASSVAKFDTEAFVQLLVDGLPDPLVTE